MVSGTGDSMNELAKITELDQSRLEFFKRDYELKLDFFVKDLDRLWNRFKFLVTFQTALFGAVGFSIEKNFTVLIGLLGVIGLGLSILWALVGYEDRLLVNRYRSHVEQAFCKVLSLLVTPVADYVHAGKNSDISNTPEPWLPLGRIPRIFSITRLPISVAGGFTVIWTALLVLHYVYRIFAATHS
jgi:hypothetical protein